MIPCVEDKCLKYPICKNRLSIECDAVNNWFYETNITNHNYPVLNWDELHIYLPRATGLAPEGWTDK